MSDDLEEKRRWRLTTRILVSCAVLNAIIYHYAVDGHLAVRSVDFLFNVALGFSPAFIALFFSKFIVDLGSSSLSPTSSTLEYSVWMILFVIHNVIIMLTLMLMRQSPSL